MTSLQMPSASAARTGEGTSSAQQEDVIRFSEKVDKALCEILPPQDFFDSPQFDSVGLINDIFPNEQACLDQLDSFVVKFKRKIRIVDNEILNYVRRQSAVSTQTSRDLEEAQRAIQGLFNKVADIKRKAADSESMVQKITKDIRQLDNCKKNLNTSVYILERLHFVVANMDQVRAAITQRKYKLVADLLEKINDRMLFFSKYETMPKIKSLQRSIKELKDDVKEQIFREFKGLETFEERTGQAFSTIEASLIEACTVVDALTVEMRDELIGIFVQQQLSLFKMLKETKIENLKKRYNNMRKLLKKYKERFIKIFPEHWKVPHEMIMDFCLQTRGEIVDILKQNKNIDAKALYQSIYQTIRFESDMQSEYHRESDAEFDTKFERETIKIEQGLTQLKKEQQIETEDPLAVVKAKFELYRRRKQLEEERTKRQQGNLEDIVEQKEPTASVKKPSKHYKFVGVISSCFDDFMDVYIQFERTTMETKLKEIMSKETWNPKADSSSAQDIFMYIQQSMNNCIVLSKGRTLFRLIDVWKTYLKKYSDALLLKLPRVAAAREVASNSFLAVVGASQDNGKFLLDAKERSVTCYMIVAAEYCQRNIEDMESVLKETIEEIYRASIKLEEEQERFYKLLKLSIDTLVLSTMNLLEPEFVKMSKIPWANYETVGDQSEYASSTIKLINDTVFSIANDIPKQHYRFFCDSFVLSYSNTFSATLYKCKKISQAGAQQLLLDMTSIGGLLKGMLNLGQHDRFDEEDVQSYQKQVMLRLQKNEVILKVLQANNEVLPETYFSMNPEGNAQEMGKILDLRGLARAERNAIMTRYEKLVNPQSQFQATTGHQQQQGHTTISVAPLEAGLAAASNWFKLPTFINMKK